MATAQEQQELIQLVVGMFGATPGADNLAALEAILDGGATIDEIAVALAANPLLETIYASTLSNEDFATAFVGDILGDEVTAENLQVGIDVITGLLNDGASRGEVVQIATTFLANTSVDDVNFGAAAQAFANKVEVATSHSVTNGLSAATLEELTAVVSDVTSDAATLSDALDAVDDLVLLSDAITLTTGDDVISGSSEDDFFYAPEGTLSDDDVILDTSLADNDRMDIVYEAADVGLVPDITNVENINVDMDMLNGAAFDAVNVTGATITVSSEKFGFDGAVTVNNLEDNNVVAGENVTDLTVTGSEDGTINAGSAGDVDITVSAAGDDVNLVVNGDVDVTTDANATGSLTVEATADSEVTLTLGGAVSDITGSGAGSLTLAGDSDDFDALEIAGVDVLNINASTSGTLDLGDTDVSTVEVSTANTLDITGNDSVTVDVTADASGVTVDSATVNYSSAVATADLGLDGDVDINVAGDVDITVTAGTAADSVSVSGTADVTIDSITTGSVDGSGVTGDLTVDTTGATTASIEIVGGTGDNTFNLTTTTGSADITTGNGTTTVDATALTSGTVAVTGGSGADTVDVAGGTVAGATVAVQLAGGDDVVSIDDNGASTFALQFGSGTDTLLVADGADISGHTFTVSGLEVISIDAADTGTATIAASFLDGTSYSVISADTNDDDTAAVDVTIDVGTATSVDLSGLTVSSGDAFTIDATGTTLATINAATPADNTIDTAVGVDTTVTTAGGDDTITGNTGDDTISAGDGDNTIVGDAGDDTITTGAGDDTIDAGAGDDTVDAGAGDDDITVGAGASTITGGTGSDEFIFVADDSTEDDMVVITDFSNVEFDLLNIGTTTQLADDADVDVAAADADAGGGDITADVVDGILTISGDDAAVIDTLAEWIDVAELVHAETAVAAVEALAFEFDGNTYVVVDDAGGATENVIQLTGLTGMVAVSGVPAVDTLVIA